MAPGERRPAITRRAPLGDGPRAQTRHVERQQRRAEHAAAADQRQEGGDGWRSQAVERPNPSAMTSVATAMMAISRALGRMAGLRDAIIRLTANPTARLIE